MTRWIAVLIVLIVSIASHAQAAEDLPSTLVETELELEKAKAEIAHQEEQWAKEKKQALDSEKGRKERYDRFNQEKQKLQESIENLDGDIQTEVGAIETMKRRVEAYDQRFLKWNDIVLAEAERLKTAMDHPFPHQVDKRRSSAALLVRDLKAGNVSVEEGFNRMWVFLVNEHQMAQEAEVFTTELKSGPDEGMEVRMVRLGKAIMVYASRDDQHLGYLSLDGKGEYSWVDEQSMDFDTREMVRRAVAVAEGALPPQFVPVPVRESRLQSFQEMSSDTLGNGTK